MSEQLLPAQRTNHDADAEALESVLRLPHGRQVVMWFLGLCNVYGSGFVPGEPDLTSFNSGTRNVGLRVISKLEEIDPETYPRLLMAIAADKADQAKKEAINVVDEAD